jgi:hypothetical protein
MNAKATHYKEHGYTHMAIGQWIKNPRWMGSLKITKQAFPWELRKSIGSM